MTRGPGKYDKVATVAREMSKAEGVVLLVVNGSAGNGFSVQFLVPDLLGALPSMLEQMAGVIRKDTGQRKAYQPGEAVLYVPMHAHGQRNHPDVERGIVSSVKGDTVFVKFFPAITDLGWDNTTAKGCDPATLEPGFGS